MTTGDVARVREHVDRTLADAWAAWPGGWPREIEAALLDAVFSIRARYTGALRVVSRWREHRGGATLDDLGQLAGRADTVLEAVRNRQRVPGGRHTKAEAVALAAGRLQAVGVARSADFAIDDDAQRRAYTSVAGLGEVTWTYLGMLLGQPGVKADVMIRRFVAEALGTPDVMPRRAEELVQAVADELEVPATHLDHAIWSYQRARGRSGGSRSA